MSGVQAELFFDCRQLKEIIGRTQSEEPAFVMAKQNDD